MGTVTTEQLSGLASGYYNLTELFSESKLTSSGIRDFDDIDGDASSFTHEFSMSVQVGADWVDISYSLTFELTGMGVNIVESTVHYIEGLDALLKAEDEHEE